MQVNQTTGQMEKARNYFRSSLKEHHSLREVKGMAATLLCVRLIFLIRIFASKISEIGGEG